MEITREAPQIEIEIERSRTPPASLPLWKSHISAEWSQDQGVGFRGGSNSRKVLLKNIFWSASAAIADGSISAAATMFFFVVVSLIQTKLGIVSFAQLLHKSPHDMVQVMLLTWVNILIVYRVSLRVYAGCTIGEWAARIRVGNILQQQDPRYPIRLILREVLSLGTGFVMFPLLSLVYKKDFLSKLCQMSSVSF